MLYICHQCGVLHHAPGGVLDCGAGLLLCRNTEQCNGRMGPVLSPTTALKRTLDLPVQRVTLRYERRAVYATVPSFGRLYSIGLRPPMFPVGSTWFAHPKQHYIRTPKVLWWTTVKLPETVVLSSRHNDTTLKPETEKRHD